MSSTTSSELSSTTVEPEPFGPMSEIHLSNETSDKSKDKASEPEMPRSSRKRKGFMERFFTQPFFIHVTNVYLSWVASPGRYVYRAIIKPVMTFVFVSCLWFWPIPAACGALTAFVTYCVTIPPGYSFYDCMYDFHAAFIRVVSYLDDITPYCRIRSKDVQIVRIIKMIYNSCLGLITKLPLWAVSILELPISMCLTDEDRDEACRRGPKQSRYSKVVMKEFRKQEDIHSAEKLHSISKKHFDTHQAFNIGDDETEPLMSVYADLPSQPKSFHQTPGAGPSGS